MLQKSTNDHGFTLIEALLSIIVLALMASAMTGLYFSGLQALEGQGDAMLLDSQLRSRMERLLSVSFDQITAGSEVVNVNGQDYTVNWTVSGVDFDGDSVYEPTVKKITVTLKGKSLSTIVVDHEGKVGKI